MSMGERFLGAAQDGANHQERLPAGYRIVARKSEHVAQRSGCTDAYLVIVAKRGICSRVFLKTAMGPQRWGVDTSHSCWDLPINVR